MTVKHLVLAALAAAGGAAAAQTLKPGLWQITQQTQGGELAQAMAQMQRQMADMPPEQRKMMQDMMAKQGVQLPSAAPGGGVTVKVCMTREMVERQEIPAQQQGDCRTTRQSRSGNTMQFAFACTNPPSRGEGQVTIVGPQSYRSKVTVTTTVDGKPQKMDMNSSGRWLASDCGSVKPFAPPRK